MVSLSSVVKTGFTVRWTMVVLSQPWTVWPLFVSV